MQNIQNFQPTITPNNSAYANVLRNVPVLNQPVYNPQPTIPQQAPINTDTLNFMLAHQNQQQPLSQQARDMINGWDRWSPFNIQGHPELTKVINLPAEGLHDIGEIATGYVNLGWNAARHPIKSLQELGSSIGDYYTNMAYDPTLGDVNTLGGKLQRGGRSIRDMYNFIYGDVTGATSQKLGDIAQKVISGDKEGAWQAAKDTGYDVWNEFAKNPLIVLSIVAPNATAKAVGSVGRGALNAAEKAGVPVGDVAKKAAGSIQAVEAKFGNKKAQLNEAAIDLQKADTKDLQLVIDNYTNGNKISPLPEKLQPLREKFIDFQKKYQDIYHDDALVNPREIAALQYVQRRTGWTMQDVRRTLAPQLEMLQEGVTEPSLLFKNRLDTFNKDINSIRKANKNKEFLKDDKPISELTRDEFDALSKHFDAAELKSFYDTGMNLKEIKQYLGDIARDSFTGDKFISAAAKNAKYQENMSKLAGLAEKTGDPALKYLYDGMRLADSGEIGAYTMADAAIPETGLVSNEGRRFQGRSSSREYGTATSEEIAKAYKNIHGFLDDVAENKLREEISRNILTNGTIDGERAIVGETVQPKDVRYISREALANGDIVDALNNASNTVQEGAIAIDKYNLNALKSLLRRDGGAFQGGMKDVHNLAKESFLGSMQYLGGNIMSGLYGTMLESGSLSNLIKDTAAAIASKGQLAKELGIYREPRIDTRRYATKFGKGMHWLNTKAGTGVARRIDATMQNLFAEINAQGALRKLGIPVAQRGGAISQVSKAQLADIIRNVKSAAMMNDRYRLIPRGAVRDYLGIVNPFLDWADTATQVTAKMYVDHPLIMGMANAELFGRIGYDKELQNRLKLKVYTNKMLKTYFADEKHPNGIKEASLSFIPQMTAVELFNDPSRFFAGNGAPALTAMWNAWHGKTPYGKPMLRSHAYDKQATMLEGDKRYRISKDTGKLEQIGKTQMDEVLSTAISSLSAAPQLINKTIMPIGTEIWNRVTGDNLRWYMPYNQSIFGSFQTNQPERSGEWGGLSVNTLSTGNPNKQRTLGDVVRGFGTLYETDYYPEDSLRGTQIRRLMRQGARRTRREQYNKENR